MTGNTDQEGAREGKTLDAARETGYNPNRVGEACGKGISAEQITGYNPNRTGWACAESISAEQIIGRNTNMSFAVVIAWRDEIVLAADSRSTMSFPGHPGHFVYNDRYQKIVISDGFACMGIGLNNFGGKDFHGLVTEASRSPEFASEKSAGGLIRKIESECGKHLKQGDSAGFFCAGRENGELVLYDAKSAQDDSAYIKRIELGDNPTLRFGGDHRICDFFARFVAEAAVAKHDLPSLALGYANAAKSISAISRFEVQTKFPVPCSVGGPIVCVSLGKSGPWRFETRKPSFYRD